MLGWVLLPAGKPKVSQNEYKSTEILLEEPYGFVEPVRGKHNTRQFVSKEIKLGKTC